jgi:hypothetical protein
MISRSESFLELKGWFHVDCDFIIEISLDFYIILVWSTLLKKYGKLSFGIVLWCTKSCFHPQHEFILFKTFDLDVMYIQIIVTIIKMLQVSILQV